MPADPFFSFFAEVSYACIYDQTPTGHFLSSQRQASEGQGSASSLQPSQNPGRPRAKPFGRRRPPSSKLCPCNISTPPALTSDHAPTGSVSVSPPKPIPA